MTAPKYPVSTVAWVEVIGPRARAGLAVFDDGDCWAFATPPGWWTADAVDSVRPLLVVDPDNEGQMRELIQGWLTERYGPTNSAAIAEDRDVRAMAGAVREMLPKPVPVKPVEPTELGSFTVDVKGNEWTRYSRKDPMPWISTNGSFATWDEIEVAL